MAKARIVIDGQTVEVEAQNVNELKNLIREMVSVSGSESGWLRERARIRSFSISRRDSSDRKEDRVTVGAGVAGR